jgi:hypothetical protein
MVGPAYVQYVLNDRLQLFILTVSSLTLVYCIIYAHNTLHVVTLVCLFAIFMYFYVSHTHVEYKHKDKISKRFEAIEQDAAETQLVLRNNVNLAKSIKRTKHLKQHIDLLQLIGRLHQYEPYDSGIFATVVSILESFMSHYASIMLQDKNNARCDNGLRHMTDLRAEMMNQMVFLMSFNVPQQDIADIKKISVGLHAKTRRYMRIASRKCEFHGLHSFVDGIDCANAHDPSLSSLELY